MVWNSREKISLIGGRKDRGGYSESRDASGTKTRSRTLPCSLPTRARPSIMDSHESVMPYNASI